MKIAITGGTGFVGSALTTYLLNHGHELYILTRKKRKKEENPLLHQVLWLTEYSTPELEIEGVDAIIHLAGESIQGKWTAEKKDQILNSRLTSTKEVIRIISTLSHKPSVLISASAIGFYGSSDQARFTESSPSKGNNFLVEVAKQWEAVAARATEYGVRTVFARFGVILGKHGGVLPRMALPYRLFTGGTIGSGKQWISWIHLQDVIQLIEWAILQQNIVGPINVIAPYSVQMNDFGKELAKVLHRPHWLPVPSFFLKTVLGEMSLLILEGQHVYPEKALQHGYLFTYPTLHHALKNLL